MKASGWKKTGRGTSNSNSRGSSYARRSRKLWLLATFGDGETAPCSFDGCLVVLTFETIEVDRFPIPGHEGGRYVRGNIRPACHDHNVDHGLQLAVEVRKKNRAARLAAEQETS